MRHARTRFHKYSEKARKQKLVLNVYLTQHSFMLIIDKNNNYSSCGPKIVEDGQVFEIPESDRAAGAAIRPESEAGDRKPRAHWQRQLTADRGLQHIKTSRDGRCSNSGYADLRGCSGRRIGLRSIRTVPEFVARSGDDFWRSRGAQVSSDFVIPTAFDGNTTRSSSGVTRIAAGRPSHRPARTGPVGSGCIRCIRR